MRTRTACDTDERTSRFSIGHWSQSHSSLDCLQWREINLPSLDLSGLSVQLKL